MAVVLLNHGVIRDHIASVHKAGCRDIERDQRQHGSVLYEYDSVDEALAEYLDSEMREQGWHERDVKVHACTRR